MTVKDAVVLGAFLLVICVIIIAGVRWQLWISHRVARNLIASRRPDAKVAARRGFGGVLFITSLRALRAVGLRSLARDLENSMINNTHPGEP